MSKKVKLYKSVSILLSEKYRNTNLGDGHWEIVESVINDHLNTNQDLEVLIEKYTNIKKEVEPIETKEPVIYECAVKEIEKDVELNVEEVEPEVLVKKERKTKRKE